MKAKHFSIKEPWNTEHDCQISSGKSQVRRRDNLKDWTKILPGTELKCVIQGLFFRGACSLLAKGRPQTYLI